MTDADALRGLKERLDTFGARVQIISQSPENFMRRYLGRNNLDIVAVTENHPSLLLDRLGDPQGPLPTNRKAVNDLMATKSNLWVSQIHVMNSELMILNYLGFT